MSFINLEQLRFVEMWYEFVGEEHCATNRLLMKSDKIDMSALEAHGGILTAYAARTMAHNR